MAEEELEQRVPREVFDQLRYEQRRGVLRLFLIHIVVWQRKNLAVNYCLYYCCAAAFCC